MLSVLLAATLILPSLQVTSTVIGYVPETTLVLNVPVMAPVAGSRARPFGSLETFFHL